MDRVAMGFFFKMYIGTQQDIAIKNHRFHLKIMVLFSANCPFFVWIHVLSHAFPHINENNATKHDSAFGPIELNAFQIHLEPSNKVAFVLIRVSDSKFDFIPKNVDRNFIGNSN